jgi:glycosyltransferase involved in cell wall biosynthesis
MISDVTVIVPAADEQDHIAACLRAINAACQHLRRHSADIGTRVIVVLDGCQDATAQIVDRHPEVEVVVSTARNVGAARRLGACHALSRTPIPAAMWLANTDADSRVPKHWLTDMVGFAVGGADVVLGTVVPGHGLPVAAEHSWFHHHHLHEGHSHVHGANLGIRGSTYLSIGGWQPLPSGEDIDIAARAARMAGVRIARTATIPVVTSSRRSGRAPHGFSSYLRELPAWPSPTGDVQALTQLS